MFVVKSIVILMNGLAYGSINKPVNTFSNIDKNINKTICVEVPNFA